jgi:hypothetical protein
VSLLRVGLFGAAGAELSGEPLSIQNHNFVIVPRTGLPRDSQYPAGYTASSSIQNHSFLIVPRTGLPRDSQHPDGTPPVDPPPTSPGFTPESGYSVSGTFSDGENITISGTGFGVKTNPKPMYLWDSRTGNLSPSPLSRRTFTINQGSPKVIDSTVGLAGRPSMRANLKPSSGTRISSGSQLFFPHTDLDGGGMNLTMFDRTRRNWDGRDAFAMSAIYDPGRGWNIKDWRYWANYGNSVINTDHMLAYGQQDTVNGDARITYEQTPPPTKKVHNIPGMPKNIWKTNYFRYKVSSTPTASDGFIKIFQNSAYAEYVNTESRSSERPDPQNRISSIQYQFVYTDINWYDWWDIIYVDDTFHAVVITEGLWGGGSTKYEMAIPISWNNTQIVANLRTGEWGNLSAKRLYVVLASGDPILIGQFS